MVGWVVGWVDGWRDGWLVVDLLDTVRQEYLVKDRKHPAAPRFGNGRGQHDAALAAGAGPLGLEWSDEAVGLVERVAVTCVCDGSRDQIATHRIASSCCAGARLPCSGSTLTPLSPSSRSSCCVRRISATPGRNAWCEFALRWLYGVW